jgi:hypothetical protein
MLPRELQFVSTISKHTNWAIEFNSVIAFVLEKFAIMADLAAEHERQHDVDSAKCDEIRAESQKFWDERKVLFVSFSCMSGYLLFSHISRISTSRFCPCATTSLQQDHKPMVDENYIPLRRRHLTPRKPLGTPVRRMSPRRRARRPRL